MITPAAVCRIFHSKQRWRQEYQQEGAVIMQVREASSVEGQAAEGLGRSRWVLKPTSVANL